MQTQLIQKRENHTVDGWIKVAFKLGNTQWCIHGASAAAKKFATKDKPLNEISARRFSALYKGQIKKAKKDKRDPKKELVHYHAIG